MYIGAILSYHLHLFFIEGMVDQKECCYMAH